MLAIVIFLFDNLRQQSPNFVAQGTGFMEDNFSRGRGRGDGLGRIPVHCIQVPLLLCGTVLPNRLRSGTGPWPGGWGPLI